MTKKYQLDSFYAISKFEKHELIKDHLLGLIDKSNSISVSDGKDLNIPKLDWNIAKDKDREWFKFFESFLDEKIKSMYLDLGFNHSELIEIWFQQYFGKSSHGWHTHGENFTNVYYLELSDSSPKTVLINPFNGREIVPEVSEGDILTFPSYVAHKNPNDNFIQRKTIISYNVSIGQPRVENV